MHENTNGTLDRSENPTSMFSSYVLNLDNSSLSQSQDPGSLLVSCANSADVVRSYMFRHAQTQNFPFKEASFIIYVLRIDAFDWWRNDRFDDKRFSGFVLIAKKLGREIKNCCPGIARKCIKSLLSLWTRSACIHRYQRPEGLKPRGRPLRNYIMMPMVCQRLIFDSGRKFAHERIEQAKCTTYSLLVFN